MNSLALIFPHQLFPDALGLLDCSRVCLVEDSLFFGDLRYPAHFHRQKLVLHRASMKAFAAAAKQHVDYFDYQSDRSLLDIIASYKPDRVRVIDPVDDMLEKRLNKACASLGVSLEWVPSPMFMTPLDWAEKSLSKKPPYRMANFYMAQRQRLNILMEGDQPAGGVWSFDTENRKKWPRKQVPPPAPIVKPGPQVAEAIAYVRQRFPDNPGELDSFNYPITTADALKWLRQFLEQRLVGFGTYEDAMVNGESILHHSVLTPMLNIGLLTPAQVIEETLAYSGRADVPMNDLEGFIRQVIGWREFMMVMYRKIGVAQRNANFWNHQRPLPAAFYTGETGVAPVDLVIRQLLKSGYSHHIERLMVLGNFMLLCEIRPDDVYRWFMEMYIDAYDWVMVPNVYGMSQFADGGWLCTKPYISGSNYIRKMSDFAPGPWCEIWDGLFWRFIDRHREFFRRQPRLSMMAIQLERMGEAKRQQHLRVAENYLSRWS